MAQVLFPSETEVQQEVKVVKSVQQIKKNAFMNAVNMNQMARDMRPELLGTKAQKIRFWIDDVDIKVKKRLEERIKIIPDIITRPATPSKSCKALIPDLTNTAFDNLDIDEEDVVNMSDSERKD